MKKLLLTSLLGLGLLFPTTFAASEKSRDLAVQYSGKKPKKKNAKSKKNASSKSYSGNNNKGCTYNGHQLYAGPRGGCYYYAGNSKEYVDRAYCSGCN